MPKYKVTKRPAGQDFVLKPNRLRMFITYLIVFFVAIVIGLSLRWLFNRASFPPNYLEQNALVGAIVIVGGSLVLSLTEYSRWTLRVIGGDRLEGPAGMFGDRLSIPIKEIDWARTRRSMTSWLKIGNAIYANSRTRILVSPWFFSPDKFGELLDLIGFNA